MLEYFGCLSHVAASDAAVYDRVVCYDIWLHRVRAMPHLFINFKCLWQFECPRVRFDHRGVDDGIRLDTHPARSSFEYLLEGLLCLLDIPILDASIYQTAKRDIVVLISCEVVLKHPKGLVQLALLAVCLDQDANLDRPVLAGIGKLTLGCFRLV